MSPAPDLPPRSRLFFGEALRVVRERAGISRHDLGNLVGARSKDIRDWERNNLRDLTPTRINKLRATFPQFRHSIEPLLPKSLGGEATDSNVLAPMTEVLRHRPFARIVAPSTPNTSNESQAKEASPVSEILPSPVYVDAVHGSDSNDGATPGTALRTFQEVVRRPPPPPPPALPRPKLLGPLRRLEFELSRGSGRPSFGKSLRLARLRADLTVEELASMLSVDGVAYGGSAVATWERENAVPVARAYRQLLDLFPSLASVKPRHTPKDLNHHRSGGHRGPRPSASPAPHHPTPPKEGLSMSSPASIPTLSQPSEIRETRLLRLGAVVARLPSKSVGQLLSLLVEARQLNLTIGDLEQVLRIHGDGASK